MKKFFIAMLMLVTVIAGVFAGETAGAGDAVLNINVTIVGKEPVFALGASAADNANVLQATGLASVGTEDTVALTETAASALEAGTAQTVNFKIYQVSDAKMFGGYNLSVEATDLVAVKPNGVQDADWNAIDASAKKFTVNGATGTYTPSITVSETTHSMASGVNAGFARLTSGTTANITYLGVLKATAQDAYTVGSFSCTWAGNVNAIPADYEATVTLIVEAN